MNMVKVISLTVSILSLTACSNLKNWLPASGPSTSVVQDSVTDNSLIEVIPLNSEVVSKLNTNFKQQLFSPLKVNEQSLRLLNIYLFFSKLIFLIFSVIPC